MGLKHFSAFTRFWGLVFLGFVWIVFISTAIAAEQAATENANPANCWEFVIPCQFDWVGDFCEGLACIEQKGQYGFIDKTGRIIIPCQSESKGHFCEGLARIQQKGKYGFINKTGKIVIPCQFKVAYDFNEGLAAVEQNDKLGFIDKTGKFAIPCQFDAESFYCAFSQGLAAVHLNGKYGYIDKNGKTVIPYRFDAASNFYDDMAWVRIDDKFGFIDIVKLFLGLDVTQTYTMGFMDKTGRIVISDRSHSSFSESLAPVKRNNYWGFEDKTGKIVIPCQFNHVFPFDEGMAAVEQCYGKWGFVDKMGKVVIPCQFDYALGFREGLAPVQQNGKWGFIKYSGTKTDSTSSQAQPGN